MQMGFYEQLVAVVKTATLTYKENSRWIHGKGRVSHLVLKRVAPRMCG